MLTSFPGLETVRYGAPRVLDPGRPPTQITLAAPTARACNAKCNVIVKSLSEREIISVVRLLVLLFITVLCYDCDKFSVQRLEQCMDPNYTLVF